jgi:RNA polymerase I-specific transcription-initiation factor
MITAMRVGLNMEQSSLPVSLVDPTHLSTFNRDTGTSQLGLRVLAFRKLQVQYGTSMEPNGDDIVLFKAFMGRRDMPLDEVLYRCTDDGIFSAFGQPQSTAIPLPVWRPFRKPPWSNKYANAENLDDFVATNELKLWALEKPLAHPHVGSLSTINQSINAKSITINWEDIYSVAAGRDNDVTEDKPPVELAEALEEVQVGITEGADPPALLQTLREMIGRPILMGDFESGSQSLEQFARGLSRTRNSQSRLAQLPRLNALAESRSVEDLFHRLSERWVATLPLSTDNRIRLSKDRLARSVAADLALASMAIGPCMETTFAMDTTEPQRRQHESIHPDIDELPSSPPSLAGEPPVRRELGFQASVPAPAPAPTEDPACARLRKYGVLSKPIIPLSTSTVLTDMLAHLPTDINVDPSSYSWRETEARLATSHAEEAAEKLHPRQEAARRKKVKKLAAAQKRRLEAQRQISQAAELDFAPPTITMSSQFPAQREVQSSQTRLVEDEDVIPVVMTQPVTGTFGSRIGPAGKAQGFKKKARQQGF